MSTFYYRWQEYVIQQYGTAVLLGLLGLGLAAGWLLLDRVISDPHKWAAARWIYAGLVFVLGLVLVVRLGV